MRILVVCDSKDRVMGADAVAAPSAVEIKYGLIKALEDAYRWAGYCFAAVIFDYDVPPNVREYLSALVRVAKE